jgi:hypothetical protein
MIAFDICMSMGGSEAVCESFYSVMATQRQVGQSNSTFEDRTLVDWSIETLRLNNADVTRPWTMGRGRRSRGGKINVKNSAFKNATKNLHFIFLQHS